ncbi:MULTISPECIES: Imm45 family immunity protein [unclassified Acinetobacter]|uniref:Imm45 family immunity protein n=1 Tax=unclassified Acinetobacter TaxID=196816 RepID=UPI000DD03C16|nr:MULTISPECIES: Imm45 family immunity protein [unclassified Acinetobacter]
MKWSKLIDFDEQFLQRGYLLKFKAHYPFEDEVIMMLAEAPDKDGLALITISGYKAGINCYQKLPVSEITKDWLISNWTKWVWPESKLEDVFVRSQLNYEEI